jgi:hypothetical protein
MTRIKYISIYVCILYSTVTINKSARYSVIHLTHLLHELNTGLQVHTEIHEDPVNTFTLVLLLFKNEHVMVEKLLELLVGEVNTKLFEPVVLKADGTNQSYGCGSWD